MNEILVVIGICLVFLIPYFGLVKCAKQRDDLKRQAVERGYAIHNPTNGVWQWK